MNPQAILSALPWARRLWKFTPPQLRVPLLVVAAVAAIWYAVEGREELRAQDESGGREGLDAT